MTHKSHFYAAIFCIFVTSYFKTNASTCTPLANSVGTNLWEILDVNQGILCGNDYHIIAQTDIPLTITEPGLYCLCETITSGASDDTVITVSSDNVIIDLNCRGIIKNRPTDGTDRAMIYIGNVQNVGITNGYLRTSTSSSPSGSLISIWAQTSTYVIVEDVQFVGNLESDNGSIGILFERSFANEVKDCFAAQMGSGFVGNYLEETIFRDCYVTTALTNGFALNNNSNKVDFINCVAYTCTGAGFLFGSGSSDAITDVICKHCVAASCDLDLTTTTTTNSGFSIANSANTMRINFVRCVAQDCHNNGFEQLGGTHILMEECFAQGNTVNGFQCTGLNTQQVNIRSCTAVRNGGNGIIALAGPVAEQIANNCFVSANVTGTQIIGFSTPVTTNALVITGTGNYWYNYTP